MPVNPNRLRPMMAAPTDGTMGGPGLPKPDTPSSTEIPGQRGLLWSEATKSWTIGYEISPDTNLAELSAKLTVEGKPHNVIVVTREKYTPRTAPSHSSYEVREYSFDVYYINPQERTVVRQRVSNLYDHSSTDRIPGSGTTQFGLNGGRETYLYQGLQDTPNGTVINMMGASYKEGEDQGTWSSPRSIYLRDTSNVSRIFLQFYTDTAPLQGDREFRSDPLLIISRATRSADDVVNDWARKSRA